MLIQLSGNAFLALLAAKPALAQVCQAVPSAQLSLMERNTTFRSASLNVVEFVIRESILTLYQSNAPLATQHVQLVQQPQPARPVKV
jgi:hypothetical protein